MVYPEIDILIDEVTPCLRDTQDNIFVDTHYEKIKPISQVTAQRMQTYEHWKFDWSAKDIQDCTIYALYADNSKSTQGLIACREYKNTKNIKGYIEVMLVESNPRNVGENAKYKGVGAHLFAIACKQSYEAGYDGIVVFYSKTELVKYYRETLHATVLFDRYMQLDTEASRILVQAYERKAAEMNGK